MTSQLRAPVRSADHQLHLAVLGGEFQGVVDQVPDHLLDARWGLRQRSVGPAPKGV